MCSCQCSVKKLNLLPYTITHMQQVERPPTVFSKSVQTLGGGLFFDLGSINNLIKYLFYKSLLDES